LLEDIDPAPVSSGGPSPLTGARSVGLVAAITAQAQPQRRHARIADPLRVDGAKRPV
jgi:hypothetical protein